MTKAVIQYAIYWLNLLPLDNEVSDTLSTSVVVQGLPNPKYHKLSIDLESCSQVHTSTENTTKSGTIVLIPLRSSGKLNKYYFM